MYHLNRWTWYETCRPSFLSVDILTVVFETYQNIQPIEMCKLSQKEEAYNYNGCKGKECTLP